MAKSIEIKYSTNQISSMYGNASTGSRAMEGRFHQLMKRHNSGG